MRMKAISGLAVALILMGGIGQLNAAGFIFNFDENGNFNWTDPTGATINYTGASSGSGQVTALANDPTTGGVGKVLIYQLPEDVNAGPVGIFDTDHTTL